MMRFTFLWLAIVAMVFPPNTAFADSITLVAGGSNGKDGGPAKEAALGQPFGVGLDSQGNLYIADYSEHRVRMVDSKLYISGFSGVVRLLDLQSGIIDKVRGLPGGRSIAVDSQGNIYVGGGTTLRVRRPNGKIEILLDKKAAETGTLTIGDNTKHLALDADENLPIADDFGHAIKKYNIAEKKLVPFAGTGKRGSKGLGGPRADASKNTRFYGGKRAVRHIIT